VERTKPKPQKPLTQQQETAMQQIILIAQGALMGFVAGTAWPQNWTAILTVIVINAVMAAILANSHRPD
jgi:uncharacterized membrane protein